MKTLILSLTVAAFALAAAAQAGDPQECPFAKAAADKKSCCADQAKTTGDKKTCADAAKAKTVKKAVNPKALALK